MEFLPAFIHHYHTLSGVKHEQTNIQYRSDLDEGEFEELLRRNLPRDLALQRTTVGVHRDDFLFLLNGNEVKRYGSQGQQKSFLIALKLAEFQCIAETKKFKPLLLLDDIFDKLDNDRIHKVLQMVADGQFGQLFITDARPDRCMEIVKDMSLEAGVTHIENGTFMR